jgi:hypothetical protein
MPRPVDAPTRQEEIEADKRARAERLKPTIQEQADLVTRIISAQQASGVSIHKLSILCNVSDTGLRAVFGKTSGDYGWLMLRVLEIALFEGVEDGARAPHRRAHADLQERMRWFMSERQRLGLAVAEVERRSGLGSNVPKLLLQGKAPNPTWVTVRALEKALGRPGQQVNTHPAAPSDP